MQALLFFILTLGTASQKAANQTEINISFSSQMNFIFSHLDKSKVPTGILRDYAMEFVNMEYFNGTVPLTDSNYAHAASFWQVYNTLLSGRINTQVKGLVNSDTIDDRWYYQRTESVITLCGLNIKYARFKDDAAENYLTIRQNQIYDKYVSNIWQNPYQVETTFLISPSVNEYSGLTFNILLPENLWITNAAGTLSVDAGDGNGYQDLIPGKPVPVCYSKAGLKEWTYRLKTSDDQYLYSHSLLAVGE